MRGEQLFQRRLGAQAGLAWLCAALPRAASGGGLGLVTGTGKHVRLVFALWC